MDAAQLKDPLRRAWVSIAIARSYANLNDVSHGFAILNKQFAFAQTQPEAEKNKLISGIIKTLTSPKGSEWLFGQEGVSKAKLMAMQLKDPAFYASVVQASAGVEASQEGVAVNDKSALIGQAEKALDEKNYPEALQDATAVSLDAKEERNKLLLRIANETLEKDDWTITLQALRSVTDAMDQSDAMLKVFETLIDKKETGRAESLAAWIPDGRRASRAYGLLANAYHDLGYGQRVEDMLTKAIESVKKVTDEKRRDEANNDLAKILADMGEVARAETLVQAIGSEEAAYDANAALAKKLADTNMLDKAKEHFDAIDDAPLALKTVPAAAIAKRLAANGEPYKAQDVLNDQEYKGSRVDIARLAIIKALVKKGEFDDASEAVQKITDTAVIAKATALIAAGRAQKGDKQQGMLELKKAMDASISLPDDARFNVQEFIAQRYMQLGNYVEAKNILAKIPPAHQKNAILYLAGNEIEQDKITDALKDIATLSGTDVYDEVAAKTSIQMAVKNHIEEAVRLARTMKGVIERVITFHKIAVIQAKHTDFYGVLGKKEQALAQSEIQPNSIKGGQLSKQDIDASEKKLDDLIKSKDTDLVAMEVGDSPLGRAIPVMDTRKLDASYLDVKKTLAGRPGRISQASAHRSIRIKLKTGGCHRLFNICSVATQLSAAAYLCGKRCSGPGDDS